jgi:hypothetical protein
VDIRTIQLMLGHADIKQTQRYLYITDEELRKAMTGVWERRRQLHAVGQYIHAAPQPRSAANSGGTFALRAATDCQSFVSRTFEMWRARQDSNLRPLAPEADSSSYWLRDAKG